MDEMVEWGFCGWREEKVVDLGIKERSRREGRCSKAPALNVAGGETRENWGGIGAAEVVGGWKERR